MFNESIQSIMATAASFARLGESIRHIVPTRPHRGPVMPTKPTATKNINTRWVEGPASRHRRLVRNKRTGQMEVKVELHPTRRLAYDMSWLPRRKLENSRPTNFKGEVAR